MNITKPAQIFLSATDGKSCLLLEPSKKLWYSEHYQNTDDQEEGDIYQHMYFTDDEEIKLGDWYLAKHNVEGHILSDKMILCQANYNFITNYYIKNTGYHFKIIASTNETLGLPKPSAKFIEKYIEVYNIGKKYTEVDLKCNRRVAGNTDNNPYPEDTLFINSDNTITTIMLPEIYTQEDMLKAFSAGYKYGKPDKVSFPNWIQNYIYEL